VTLRSFPNPAILLFLSLSPTLVAGQQPRAPADSAHVLDSLAAVSWAVNSVPAFQQAADMWLSAAPLAEEGGQPRLAGRYLFRSARASYRGSDRDRYFEVMPQAIERLLAAGDSGLADSALIDLGNLYQESNQLVAARGAWRRAAAVAEATGLRSERAWALADLALEAVAHEDGEAAVQLVENASDAFLLAGDSGNAFGVYSNGGAAAEERPDTVLALRLYRAGIDRSPWADSVPLATVWLRVGLLQRGSASTRDSALHALTQALSLTPVDHDTVMRARVEAYLGQTLTRAERPRDALPHLVDASRLAIASDDWEGLRWILRLQVTAYSDLGDHGGARAAYAELARRAEERSDTAVWVEGLQGEGAELAVTLDSPAEALGNFRRALEMARAAGLDSLADEATRSVMALGKLTGLLRETRRFLRADADSQTALGHPRAAAVSLYWLAGIGDLVDSLPGMIATLRNADSLAGISGDSLLQGKIRILEAAAYNTFGQSDSGRVIFRRALAILGGTGNSDELLALGGVASGWLELGQRDSALAYGKRSLALARQRHDFKNEVNGLGFLAGFYRALKTPAALRRSIAYYDSATSLVEEKVASTTFEPAQSIAFSGGYSGEFNVAMAWLGLAPTIGRARAARGALLAVERRRGMVVRSARSRAAPLPAMDAVLDGFRRRRAAALIFVMPELDIRPAGAVVVDSLITLVVDPSGTVAGYVLALPRDSLYGILDSFREGCCTGVTDSSRSGVAGLAVPPAARRRDPRGSLARLSRTILTPRVLARLRGAREIVIEPEILTSFALFAAAPLGRHGEPFGIRYPIRFTISLALAGDAARAPVGGTPLIVGNPRMPSVHQPGGGETQLPPLAGAREEADWVGRKLGAPPLTADGATETEVRQRIPSASIVHLATHGFGFKSLVEPRAPFVALAPDSVNDGLLTVREMLDDPNLRLRAELVVLSACQTGLGKPGDEGMNGLQRAFLMRGARSVIYSLWSVSDEATRLFMQGFYRHWLDDPDHPGKSEALRRTRSDLRRIPRFRAPYYWAAFQLMGAD